MSVRIMETNNYINRNKKENSKIVINNNYVLLSKIIKIMISTLRI